MDHPSSVDAGIGFVAPEVGRNRKAWGVSPRNLRACNFSQSSSLPLLVKLDLSGIMKFEQLPDLVTFGAVESLLLQQMCDQPMSRPVEDMVEYLTNQLDRRAGTTHTSRPDVAAFAI
jgi:hypothetical protein